MKQLLSNRLFLLCLRGVLAATFIYAGVIKIMAPQDFADSIATFQILPAFLLSIVALTLPNFEVFVGGLLLAGRFKRQAAASIFGLASIFAIVLVQALVRGLDVDCGCFGSRQPEAAWSAWFSLGRSVLILGSSGWLYRAFSKEVAELPNNIESFESDGSDLHPVELLSTGQREKAFANKKSSVEGNRF